MSVGNPTSSAPLQWGWKFEEKSMVREIEWPARPNLTAYFLEARIAEGRGDRVALRCGDRQWSYAEVSERADRFARALRAQGVRPEERVVIALSDGVDFVAALFGTLKIGAVVVMVNPGSSAEEVAYFLGYTRASAAVVGTRADSHVAAFAPQEGTRLAILRAGEHGDAELDQLAPQGAPALACFDSHRDDAAIWLFSGGTTGRPKAVVQCHGSFIHTTQRYAHGVLGYREDDIILSVPKLYFGYATGSNLLFPFSVGASAVLFEAHPTAELLLDLVEKHRPTMLINVPTMIGKMLAVPGAQDRDMSSLRLATSAGEALPVPLHERWREIFGVELLDGLGTAEMWHVFLSNRPGHARPGTLGQVVPGFEIKVCDDEGNTLPDGETGWMWVRGESRAHGYWQRHEESCRAFRGEWYASGDMLSRDAEGFYTYQGRGDDMLKVSGKWLAPGEVESCLLRHPAVLECAVVGVPDARGLIKPMAFVQGEGPREEGLDEALKAFVREHLEPYKAPRDVVFLGELPRTHLGKVDRGKLRADASIEGGAA